MPYRNGLKGSVCKNESQNDHRYSYDGGTFLCKWISALGRVHCYFLFGLSGADGNVCICGAFDNEKIEIKSYAMGKPVV